MALHYIVARTQDTNVWFAVTDDNGAPSQVNLVDGILCAHFMTNVKERRMDGDIIAEVVLANTETGEQVGRFERSPQTNLFSEVNG